jgi:pimeloyl-ACP methyl ester carboxylesterase
MAALFVPINQNFMKSLTSFDPPAAIKAVRQPVLIVQGGRDLQVRPVDADVLHAARPDAQEVIVPLANHVLKQASDTTLMGQMSLYQTPTTPIMPEVVTAIADWILRLKP